jgi:hypothetical protein
MPVKNLINGQYVRIKSVKETLKESGSNASKVKLIKESLGQVRKTTATSDNLKKCILGGSNNMGSIIFCYEDLEICDQEDMRPKGGTFDVQNLVS